MRLSLSTAFQAAVSTALPVITSDLHGIQFIWVGSAYTLASTAFLPMSGGLAQMFGRRVVMLGALAFFALGSALCGAAPSMQFLIAGRGSPDFPLRIFQEFNLPTCAAVQGLGSGGIISLSQIILADMVTLRERGLFNGLTGLSVLFPMNHLTSRF
jgi:MFS family permease